MAEIHFIVEDAAEGSHLARAVGADIFTEAEGLTALYAQIRDGVQGHFDPTAKPSVIRLHAVHHGLTRDQVLQPMLD